ncbi:N-formylglutamate deformylase [Pokkaliibacter sp. MBI-7]|uniref:N-formylglutamate deformylase n=1 Tax=Pokkaliibacter sp. MBI-7 TaxID=3040600 RepID=UPI00244CECDD|nr:N-formylglutamate deformylase [Pokkaliibacter sp. MBI-7]MDH2431198.1 N-formylglutamate deformylase [Pokkaliibacter sp. MBI-7]
MYQAFEFRQGKLPLLISMPHTGTWLTDAVAAGLTEEALKLQDTDWHMPRLYDFAEAMGASLLMANYSRYVVDLNRPADDQPLYQTATTGLFPDINFDGTPLFRDGLAPSREEHDRYLEMIWKPYHQQIERELSRLRDEFGYALLFDAHSIRSEVPRLFDGRLPDFNLGTNSGESCAPDMQSALVAACAAQQQFSHVLNGRFKGGYITRCFGRPEQHWHAVQLELAQLNYMSEDYPFGFEADTARPTQALIQQLLQAMLNWAGGHYRK